MDILGRRGDPIFNGAADIVHQELPGGNSEPCQEFEK
jgi:hypothetical protein